MRKSILFAAVFALAACNGADNEADDADVATTGEMAESGSASDVLEGEAPGFEAVAPGTYQVTRAGGEVDYIEIHPGMTFSRVAADGTMKTTAANGDVATVRPVEGKLEDHAPQAKAQT